MPSKSASQARLMAAAAHTPGGYGGVPQSVGREFNKADTGKKRSALPEHVGKLRKRGLISDRQHEKMEGRSKERGEHSKAHPGFAAVEGKIGREPGIRNPGAVLAAASRGASKAAHKANPRLNKVHG